MQKLNRYIEGTYINMVFPRIPLHVALMRNKDVIIVAKSKGSTLTICNRVHLDESVLSQMGQKITTILRHPKTHYCLHSSPILFPVPSQNNRVRTLPNELFQIYINTILPPTHRSSKRSPFLGFSHQIRACNSSLSHLCHLHVRRMVVVHYFIS
jgi:hypothetical protein